MKKTFFFLFISLILLSCSSVPRKTVDENGSYLWKPEVFELNPRNKVFTAEGAVTMWINVEQFKGKFTGDYQIMSASPDKWRMMITGPFNISVATVIINGENASIFHEGIWDNAPWSEVSGQLFNAPVDGDLLSVMLGGRFRFEGECADIGTGAKLCRKNGIYYKIVKNRVTEIVSGGLYIVSEKKSAASKRVRKGRRGVNTRSAGKQRQWVGINRGKHAFIFENKRLDSSSELQETLFEPPKSDEPDIFDEL